MNFPTLILSVCEILLQNTLTFLLGYLQMSCML